MTEKTKIEDKISKGKIKTSNSKGTKLYIRDDNGLLQNVIYEFNEDGSINWRAMIKEEHLFPNRSWFESRGKDCPRSIDGLADHQLLIKLAGIKELAKLRGFESISYDTVKCDEGHVAVCCSVSFTPNYETGSQSVTFQDMANATLNNTSSFATKFLETIACNRAFVRCVRNFLNVHIVGDDEIDKSDKKSVSSAVPKTNSNPFSPVTTLQKQAESVLGCTDFQDFKSHIREWWRNKVAGVYQNESISKWEDWSDISDKDARILVGVISKS
jgi:hypothetical protein